MKYIIMSDLHANDSALSGFINNIASKQYDKIIFLGDLAGYERTSFDLFKKFISLPNLISIRGNADLEASKHDTGIINNIVMSEYFDNLPIGPQIIDNCFGICHGSAFYESEYLNDAEDTPPTFRYMKNNNLKVMFFGHTHTVKYYVKDKHGFITDVEKVTDLLPGHEYLICPGTLGKPKYGLNRGSYILYDTHNQTIETIRFDIR